MSLLPLQEVYQLENSDDAKSYNDPERLNVKALYRKGQAHAMVHEFEAAVTSLQMAAQLEPDDTAIRRALDKALWRLQCRKDRERKAMAAAFGNLSF